VAHGGAPRPTKNRTNLGSTWINFGAFGTNLGAPWTNMGAYRTNLRTPKTKQIRVFNSKSRKIDE
jgi:hypothetical protein